MFEQSKSVGNQTRIKQTKTESGVKDTYQQHFLDQLHDAYKQKRGAKAKEEALKAHLAQMQDNPTSPVWRIAG
jgi:hypothetical protein